MDKKFIIVALSFLVMFALIATVVLPMIFIKTYDRVDRVAPSEGYGDVNGDGLVSIYASAPDLIYIHNYYIQYPDWDVNGDGQVNDADTQAITAVWDQIGAPHWIKEDINWDGKISILDIAFVGQHWGESYTNPNSQDRLAVMNISFSQSEFERRADVNGDGIINSVDENYLIQYATGAIDKFPVQNETELIAGFSYPSTIRAGVSAQFTDTSTGTIVSWSWNFGDGTTSNEQNPTHTYESAGTYTVTLTISNGITSDSISHTITVYGNTPPVAEITLDITNQLDCYLNESRTFDASSSYDPDGYITKYHWDFGDGATTDTIIPSVTHTYKSLHEPYGYWLTLTVYDNDGLSGRDTAHVVVHNTSYNPPSASFTYRISGLTVSFTDTSKPSGTRTLTGWNWDFGDGTASSEQNPIHTYSGYGTYTVTLTVTDNLGASGTCSNIIQLQEGYYSLSVTVDGKGTVSPSSGSYPSGTTVTITAMPSSGWKFDHWSGDASGTDPTITVTMDGNKVITAHFVKTRIPVVAVLMLPFGLAAVGAGIYYKKKGGWK